MDSAGKLQIGEQVDQMAADIAPEKSVGNIVASRRSQNLLNGSADIGGGVYQRSVDVKQIERGRLESRRLRSAFEHAGRATARFRLLRLNDLLRAVARWAEAARRPASCRRSTA